MCRGDPLKPPGNVYHGVDVVTQNPLHFEHFESGAQTSWEFGTDSRLPFGGWTKWVGAICPAGQLKYANDARCMEMPGVFGYRGTNKDRVLITWGQPVKGGLRGETRMDNPS